LEEIREAKLKQAEKRQEAKKEKLVVASTVVHFARLTSTQDAVKNDIRLKKRRRNGVAADLKDDSEPKAPRKRVSFG
jgi:hypothetical protein